MTRPSLLKTQNHSFLQELSESFLAPDLRPFRIHLEAKNEEKNLHRFYTLYLQLNLFGHWSVILTFGRKNTVGRQKIYTFGIYQEALQKVKNILKKRSRAYHRIQAHS